MRHDGTENTGNVTGGERNDQLFALGALISRLGNDVLVKSLDGTFETSELHHGVRNLPTPQWNQRFVKSINSFGGQDLGESFPESGRECSDGGSLNPYFDGFHGAQSDIGEEFGGSGSRQIQRGSIKISVFGPDGFRVQILENFVESELAQSLSGITDSGGSPTQEKTSGSAFLERQFESISKTLVFLLIDLKSTFDKIQRSDGGVSQTARQNSTKSAQREILARSKFARIIFLS
jgi:hypothetical protein